MKKLFIFLCLIHNFLAAEYLLMGKSELPQIDLLIQATEKSLQQQKYIQNRLEAYAAIQEAFQKNPADNKILAQMVNRGSELLQLINDANIQNNFSPDFINELTVLKQFTKKGS